MQEDFAQAAYHYQRAVHLDPGLLEPRWGLGHLCFELGQHRAAVGWFRQVAAGVPVRMALLVWCTGRATLRTSTLGENDPSQAALGS